MAEAKEAFKKTKHTHGKCDYCPEQWDPGTDMRGWNFNKKRKTWNVCPSCNRYKKHIADAFRDDRKRYWAWFSCKCGAFTQELTQWRDHNEDCPGRFLGTFKLREEGAA